MKRIKVRRGVFETNSSSTHAVVVPIDTKDEIWDCSLVPDSEGVLRLNCDGEFGWQWERFNDAETKAKYVAQYAHEYYDYCKRHGDTEAEAKHEVVRQQLEDVLKEVTGAREVVITIDEEEGYVDHQSYDEGENLIEDYTRSPLDLKRLIFDRNAFICLGNDNQLSPYKFYEPHVILPYNFVLTHKDTRIEIRVECTNPEEEVVIIALDGDEVIYDKRDGCLKRKSDLASYSSSSYYLYECTRRAASLARDAGINLVDTERKEVTFYALDYYSRYQEEHVVETNEQLADYIRNHSITFKYRTEKIVEETHPRLLGFEDVKGEIVRDVNANS